jgi:hypothetical protein
LALRVDGTIARSYVRFWTDRPERARGPVRLPLTSGNVAVALATTIVTIAALGLGLPQMTRTSSTVGSSSPPRTGSAAGASDTSGSVTAPSPTATTSVRPSLAQPASSPPGTPGAAGSRELSRLAAHSGPGQIAVSWRLPETAVRAVRATITGNDGSRPSSTCTPTATGCTFTGLTNGVEYTVEVALLQGNKVVAGQKVKAIPYPTVLAERTTRLWFDPADPGDLITAGAGTTSGAVVRHLLDRSANGADAGPASGLDLPTTTTINGHTALMFGATRGMSFPASSLPTGAAPSTVYAVAALDSPSAVSDWHESVVLWGTTQPNALRALLKSADAGKAYADTYGTWQSAPATLGWDAGRVQIMRADFTADTLSVWMDGVSSYVWQEPSDSKLATGTAPDGMLGSAPWSPSGGWQGRIAEVIVLSAVPTPGENASIMQYLQRKWGL